jgi:hypothetical protein
VNGKNETKQNSKRRKDQEIHFRLTSEELESLELASYVTDKSKSDILRTGLQMYLSGIKGHF